VQKIRTGVWPMATTKRDRPQFIIDVDAAMAIEMGLGALPDA